MKVLVTGANGMFGSDLCPILEQEGYELIKTDVNNLDITDFDKVLKFFNLNKPDIVIHCAAYTDVNNSEVEKNKATQINAIGTKNIAIASAEQNATLVYISTDYVFDGNSNIPYKENSKPYPINHYGFTKYQGEQYVTKYCNKYYIVRPSWLYGINGKNFVDTMISLKNRPEIKVVKDQIGCPTWTVDLAKGIIDLIKTSNYGIHHICGNGETSWYDFAKEIFQQIGLEVNIIPCNSEDYPSNVKRPKYSVLANSPCRYWKVALKEYLELNFGGN